MPNFFNKYPYTDFHELNLDWILETVKKVVEEWAANLTEWHNTQEEWNALYTYVHDYFDNLDVQEEINNKIDEMANDGSLYALFGQFIGFVNPEMFGAVGDGVTDDTAAVQECVNSGTMIFGSNRYHCTAQISVPSNRILNGLTIISSDNSDNIIACNNVNNVKFINCTIIGDDILNLDDNYHKNGIVFNTVDNFQATGCDISHLGGSGIYITHSSNGVINNNYFHDNDNTQLGRDVIVGYSSDDNEHIRVINNSCLSVNQMGIIVQGANNDIVIENNTVNDKHGYGICLYGNDGFNTNIRVCHNRLKNIHYNPIAGYYNGMGIYCVTIKDYVCDGNILENIMLDRPDAASPSTTLNPGAITCGEGYRVSIINNKIQNSVIFGVACTYLHNADISHNYIEGDVLGVKLFGEYITMIGNIITNKVEITTQYQVDNFKFIDNDINVAIVTTGSVNGSNFVIRGNTIKGAYSAVIGIGHVDNLEISNNIIERDTSFTSNMTGIRVTDDTNCIISNNIIGHDGQDFYMGIRCDGSTNAVVSDNIIKQCTSNQFIQVYDTAVVNRSNNKHDGTVLTSDHLGINPGTSQKFVITIEPGTAAPTAGYHYKGSMVINTANTSETGWICTDGGTPGTWSAFTL